MRTTVFRICAILQPVTATSTLTGAFLTANCMRNLVKCLVAFVLIVDTIPKGLTVRNVQKVTTGTVGCQLPTELCAKVSCSVLQTNILLHFHN